MKFCIISLLITLPLLGIGCADSFEDIDTELTIDRDSILLEARESDLIMDDEEIAAMASVTLEIDQYGRNSEDAEWYLKTDKEDWWSAALADVKGGGGYGIAHATLRKDSFTLVAEMGNLADQASGYYYEGWLVRRKNPLRVLSLGRAQKTQDGHAIVYLSNTDLSDHDFFVLTLEVDDGNLAPGEHILEGILK